MGEIEKIDDSELFHYAVGYDPAKARAYYLANRKLKGRKKGQAKPTSSRVPARRPNSAPAVRAGGKPNRAYTKSRQEELRAQKARLQKRLEHLRDVLEEKVAAAKRRSGGDPNKKQKDEKDKAPETKADKADRNKDEKSKKPLTAKQKADKAKKAKKEYEKEHPTSLSEDVEILQEQVKDIQAKIQKAVADAQARRNKAGSNNSRSGSKNQHSGPRGR
jgi:chaperonin cofactor prefoldin